MADSLFCCHHCVCWHVFCHTWHGLDAQRAHARRKGGSVTGENCAGCVGGGLAGGCRGVVDVCGVVVMGGGVVSQCLGGSDV